MVVSPPPHSRTVAPSSSRLTRIHLCSGILERDGCILLVASRYPNHPQPLWNLPGGRQDPGELLPDTLTREFAEETGLRIAVGGLVYLSESYDGPTHFTNSTFAVSASGEPRLPRDDAHVVALKWVRADLIAQTISVTVVREPLVSFLGGSPLAYYGYAQAGVSIEFAD